jgi:hypothetical protein
MANTNSISLVRASSQYLSITDASQTGLDITGDISIEFWLKLSQLPSTASDVMRLVGKLDNVNPKTGYEMYFNSNDTLTFRYFDDSGNRTLCTSDAAFVVGGDVDDWVHIAVTVDVSTQTFVMYKDTSSQACTVSDTNASSIGDNSDPFLISSLGGAADFIDGLVDEVRVWNDVRTGTEISDNYMQELAGTEGGLVGYWKLNNNLTDSTSNGNDLTNNNSATFSSDVPFGGGSSPSSSPSASISGSPSSSPSSSPSGSPSASISGSPSGSPSSSLSGSPSGSISGSPSSSPSASLSGSPSSSPSTSTSPSSSPSQSPSSSLSGSPSSSISGSPSGSPSSSLSGSPSSSPSSSLSGSPSASISGSPSSSPSSSLSGSPSSSISGSPSSSPSGWINVTKNTSTWVNLTKNNV